MLGLLVGAGLGRLVWMILRVLGRNGRTLLLLVSAAVALRMASAFAAPLPVIATGPDGHTVVTWVALGAGIVSLCFGVRSRQVLLIRRRLRHRGWSL